MALSITEVAAASGLRPSALRYYEEAGLITPLERRGGRRQYDPDVLSRLGLIALCQEAGLTIAEIRQLLDGGAGSRDRWQQLARTKLGEIDSKIAQLQAMRTHLEKALACECGRVEGCQLVQDAAERRRRTHRT